MTAPDFFTTFVLPIWRFISRNDFALCRRRLRRLKRRHSYPAIFGSSSRRGTTYIKVFSMRKHKPSPRDSKLSLSRFGVDFDAIEAISDWRHQFCTGNIQTTEICLYRRRRELSFDLYYIIFSRRNRLKITAWRLPITIGNYLCTSTVII